MNPFRGRTAIVLALVVGVSLLAMLLWGVFGNELAPARSSGADSFSRSALGYRAFVSLLEELGVPTVVSRFNSVGRARTSALLVVAEPVIGVDETRRRMLRVMIQRARTLLVLPKWRGIESEEEPGFIEAAELIAPDRIQEVLGAIGADVDIVRIEDGRPLQWEYREIGAVPRIDRVQLLNGANVRPVVRCAEGTLLGYVDTNLGTKALVLSDPDLISNHGLLRPGNALATMGIIDLARGKREAVVIDETLHGFGKEPSLFRSLFEFPLGLATIQALFAAAALLWAAVGRFGAPHPVAPPHEAGKKALIGNIAALLAYGGHGAHALRRYLDGAVAEVRAALHVPSELKAADAEARLDRAHGSIRLRDLRELVKKESADRRHILAIARRIHRWREETIGGRIGHP